MFWKKKLLVEKYEDEFKTSNMRNRKLFYDLFARVGDPEELKTYSSQILDALDYKAPLIELTKFEESTELEGVFLGGRLKPIKGIIKAIKEIKRGSRFPILWKTLAIIGIILLILGGFPQILQSVLSPATLAKLNLRYFLYGGAVLLLLGILLYLIKEKVRMYIWLKLVGVYDIESKKADMRIVIAGDVDKKDMNAFSRLEEDVSELYNELARKYVKKKEEEKPLIVVKEKESPEAKIISAIKEIENKITSLDSKLAEGKIKENAWKEARESLKRKKEKLEILLDLLKI